ncbi:16S rRNA (uracil(1498)-N(3))-methyltransferase [Streptomyces spiramenti]|uniref:Ribosomal RNA small subunit methyltransferase E n=1 Tax=Streptomyces spiramenti TaxID=2720606 RepID=A0ABX1AL97_9ACTN|nr:16S rRNA (uracil(1498)-N(3))-methyltransferase [Streptomyces spiramenti]NJP65252.1 16S rRNA (uracil(1498)-N(3))-methyltransferase [Streptomyces spiramenti]
MTAPVFLHPDVGAATPGARLALDGPEGRHAVSVKRLRPGEELTLTDGAGAGAVAAVVETSGKDRLLAEVRETRWEPPPEPWLTVVQALPKGDRGEVAVETMTETGVDAVVPWAAARCVTRWREERGAKALAKWRSTAREAGKQSRRMRFPEVAEPVTTRQLLPLLAAADLAVVLHEEGDVPLAGIGLPASGRIVLVVGPEGGIGAEELAELTAAGASPCRLGRSVLRTSTAGTAAAAVLLARTGRWG